MTTALRRDYRSARSRNKAASKTHWAKARVGEVFRVVGGGTPPTSNPEFWNGDIPWITSADIDERHNVTPRRHITRRAIESSATNLVPKGSIVVVTRVGLGKVAEAKEDLCFSQDCHGLLFDQARINPRFAVLQLSRMVQIFRHVSRGTTISGVTKKQLLELDFLLPPMEEQLEIVAEIEKQFSITLRARSALGVLPALAEHRIPDHGRTRLREAYERTIDAAYRSGPESIVDRCRDAAQVAIGIWFAQKAGDASLTTIDLSPLLDKLDQEPVRERPLVLSNAARVIARLHARKPNERIKRSLPPLSEADAEAALANLGLILRELHWTV